MAEDKKKEIDVTVIEVTEEYLKEKLYKIRGKRVLLDADLAEIYGYDTKGFNRQVKNNIEKFDEDFMFELTDEELEDLRYKNCTAINILVKNWVKLAGLLKKTIGERGKYKKKLECYKAK